VLVRPATGPRCDTDSPGRAERYERGRLQPRSRGIRVDLADDLPPQLPLVVVSLYARTAGAVAPNSVLVILNFTIFDPLVVPDSMLFPVAGVRVDKNAASGRRISG
jgi:hypothetical protein